MINHTGRRYTDFQKQARDEAACLLFKPVPMLIAEQMLKVPRATNNLNGVKQGSYQPPRIPNTLIGLANTLGQLNRIPAEVLGKKMEREVIALVKSSFPRAISGPAGPSRAGSPEPGSPDPSDSGNESDFVYEPVLKRRERSLSLPSPSTPSVSRPSSPERRGAGGFFTQPRTGREMSVEPNEILSGRNHGGRRMGAGRPSRELSLYAAQNNISIKEARAQLLAQAPMRQPNLDNTEL